MCACVRRTGRCGLRWAGSGLQLQAARRGEMLERGWQGSRELRWGPWLHPSSLCSSWQEVWRSRRPAHPLLLATAAAWSVSLAAAGPICVLSPPHVPAFPVLFDKTVSAAGSGCSPGAHEEHLASLSLHADCFFGKQVKVGVITFMNHCGNREILFFIDLCSIALIPVGTRCSYRKLYEHYSFRQ